MSKKGWLILVVLGILVVLMAAGLGLVAAVPEVLPTAVLVRLPHAIQVKIAAELYRRIRPGPYLTDPAIRRQLELVTRLDPGHPLAWGALCDEYANASPPRTDLAVDACRRQIEVNPSREKAYDQLGQSLISAKDFPAAEEAFRKQLEVDPCSRFTYGSLARVLDIEHRRREAIDVLTRAIDERQPCQRGPVDVENYAYYHPLYWQLLPDLVLEKQYDKALPFAREWVALEFPSFISPVEDKPRHMYLAVVYEKLGRTEEARAEYAKAGYPAGWSCVVLEDTAGAVHTRCAPK